MSSPRILSPFAPLLLLTLLISPRLAGSALLSIDLGSEWLKVAVVNLRPGQSPISVVINEMSKRKSPALVAISGGDRLVGEEAAGISARYPENVYSRVRDLLGKPFVEAEKLLKSQYLPYRIKEDPRGAAVFEPDGAEGGGSVYTPEEILAMTLEYARKLGEAHIKAPLKDAVISVPPYWGQSERECMLSAASLAGINVLALINEHAAAAIQYGIDKDFSNGSKHVVFYDMGANSVYAALVLYSSYTAKEYGRNISINQFQVKDVRWDASLGGQAMEMRLVEYFADIFNKELGGGVDIRNNPKAMAKLKKQVKRTKEVLSANLEALMSVEALYNDHDFRNIITRLKFEELCKDLWERALEPIKKLLDDSGLKVTDLHAVELIGGGTRVPKLQALLSEYLGKRDLDKHLDADEAIVLGAALHAANISDGVKMNRKLGMIDGSSYGIFMKVEGSEAAEDKDYQLLVPRTKKIPIKVFKSLGNTEDFKVSLVYDDPTNKLPPGIVSAEIATYQISGVTDAFAKYSSRNLSKPIKTNLHFALSRSSVVSLDRAETVVEAFEWHDVLVKNITAADISSILNSTEVNGNASEGNQETEGSEKGEDGLKKGNETISYKGSESSLNLTEQLLKPVFEKKLRKRTFRVPLKIIDISSGAVRPLSKDKLLEAAKRLEKLNIKDAEKRRTAEAKNNLESYIYSMKDKLESTNGLDKVSTEVQLNSFKEDLSSAEDWLYTDGEEASAIEFEKRLDSLKAVGDGIFFRLAELEARPKAIDSSKKYLKEVKETLEEWEKSKPWIGQSSKDELLSDMKKFQTWITDKESEQKSIPGHEEPVFTSDEIYAKAEKLKDKVTKASKTPKPKPKVEKPPSANETSPDGTKPNGNGANSSKLNDEAKPDEEAKPNAEESNPDGTQSKVKPDAEGKENDEDYVDEL